MKSQREKKIGRDIWAWTGIQHWCIERYVAVPTFFVLITILLGGWLIWEVFYR